MNQESHSSIRGWTVTSAALGINLILGALYAWGVIAKALVVQWKWTKTDAALPFTISTAAFALTMIFAGRCQDKIGPRFVAMAGGIMFGLGLFTSSFSNTPLLMAITFGLLGGIGLGLCYSATTPPAIKWFPPAKKGLITGIVVSGVGIAAVYVSPLTAYLLGITSIPQTFMILGGSATVLICLFSLGLTNPPAGYVAAPGMSALKSAKPAAIVRPSLDWPEMLRSPQFFQLWIMFVLSASAGLMIIAHVAIIAREQAGVDKWGFLPIAMLAVFNTLGRLTSGYVSDRIGRTQTMILAFVLQAINMFAFVHYTTPGMVVFGASFTGLCYGAIFTLMPAASAEFYGVRNLGVNYGLLFTAFGVAGVTGPILAGVLREKFGSYSHSFTICAVMLVVAAVLAITTKAPKTQHG